MRRSGFTLIELLIVIGILSILAAIILPALASSRRKAKTITCLSNLRQIGMAISAYGADYDGRLPYAVDCEDQYNIISGISIFGPKIDAVVVALPTIVTATSPYGASSSVYSCPLDRFFPNDPMPHQYPTWFQQFGSSYLYPTRDAYNQLTLSLNGAPANDILMSDYAPFHGGEENIPTAFVNVLYGDGHVKTLTWTTRSDLMDNPPQ